MKLRNSGTLATVMGSVALICLLCPAAPAADQASAGEEGFSNRFFVFDNGLGGIENPAQVLEEVGCAGMGASGFRISGLVKRYGQSGRKVFSTYVGCRLDKTPAYDSYLKEAVKELKGSGVILWLTVNGGKYGQEDEKAVAVIREIADLAAAADLRVALYPHTGFYVATTADALRLVKKADRKNLGASLNLCHELMTGQGAKLDATIREAAAHLFLVSINGADHKRPGYGWNRLIQPLGRGDFDVYGLLKKLKAAGYRGPIGLQCYGVKGDRLENLKESMKAWREYSARRAAEGS